MKTLTIILAIVLMTGLVFAGISLTTSDKLTLDKTRTDFLKAQGIKVLSVNEYECNVGSRCFKLSGDMNETLISIPLKVSSGYKIIRTKENRTVMINGKPITREVFVNKQTTEKVYRDITDKEIMNIISNSVNVKVDKMMPKNEIPKSTTKYNPIIILDGKP